MVVSNEHVHISNHFAIWLFMAVHMLVTCNLQKLDRIEFMDGQRGSAKPEAENRLLYPCFTDFWYSSTTLATIPQDNLQRNSIRRY
jgi:hypothetical protein